MAASQETYYSAKPWDGVCECPNNDPIEVSLLVNSFLSNDTTDGLSVDEVFKGWVLEPYFEHLNKLNSTSFEDSSVYLRITEIYSENWLLEVRPNNQSTQVIFKIMNRKNDRKVGIGVYELSFPKDFFNTIESALMQLNKGWIIPAQSVDRKYKGEQLDIRVRQKMAEMPNGITNYSGPSYYFELNNGESRVIGHSDRRTLEFVEMVLPLIEIVQFKTPIPDCGFTKKECPKAFE